MIFSILTNAVHYAPSVLAHVVAFAVGGVLWGRHRRAATLLLVGTGLQLGASILSFSLTTYVTAGAWEGSSPNGVLMTVIGVVASLVRAVGELGVVAAVFVGASGAVAKSGTDPYGYPEVRDTDR